MAFNLTLALTFLFDESLSLLLCKSRFSLARSAWYITLETRCAMKKAAVRSILVVVVLLVLGVIAEAQQPKKVPRIGYLIGQSRSTASVRIDPFRQGLRELGYVEGKTLSLSGDHLSKNLIPFPRLRRS